MTLVPVGYKIKDKVAFFFIFGGNSVLRQLIFRIKKSNYARKLYFHNAGDEITEYNLQLLRIISSVATFLILFLILLTPFIVRNWHPTFQHILFIPSTALFMIISYYYGQKKEISQKVVDSLCLSFCIVVIGFVISIDIFPCIYSPSSFMQIIIIVLPVIFIFKFRIIYTVVLVFEIIYAILLYYYKSEIMFQNDLFNSIVGIIIFFILEWMITEFRVESYNIRNKYQQLSTFDALTGVMNKNNCEREINEYLNRQKDNERCSLIIIDIDNYKTVNDRLGHQVGDVVLERVGRLLIHSFDTSDIIGRIGGDEFAVLMDSVTDKNILKKKCELLYSKVESISEAVNFNISFSIGVAIQGDAKVTFEEMFRSADDALYEAKSFGKARCIMHIVSKDKKIRSDRKVILIAVKNYISRRKLIEEFSNDFEIIEASSSRKTLSELSKYNQSISIIILDMMMPEIDGYQLLKYMKSRQSLSHIPVIAVIPNNKASHKRSLNYGAMHVLNQPIDSEKARLVVMEIVNNQNNKTAEQI